MKKYKPSIFIYGAGRVGGTLYYSLLRNKNYVKACTKRDRKREFVSSRYFIKNYDKFDVVILSVPDRELENVVEYLKKSPVNVKGKVLLHTSGTISYKILKPLEEKGFIIGSLHPYFSFYKVLRDVSVDGIIFSLSCSIEHKDRILNLLKKIGIKSVYLSDDLKVPYHISAVFVSNFSALLLKVARILLKKTDIPDDKRDEMIFSLLGSTIYNLKKFGIEKTITGPAIRGDKRILHLHKKYLKNNLYEFSNLYSMCTTLIQKIYE